MDNSRLRIATRIHYLLARYLGDGIDVSAMLKREDYAREVLYVCAAADDPELHALAKAWRAAPAVDPSLAFRPTSAQPAGFEASRPLALAAKAEPCWYKPSTWFASLDA